MTSLWCQVLLFVPTSEDEHEIIGQIYVDFKHFVPLLYEMNDIRSRDRSSARQHRPLSGIICWI